MRQSIVVLDNLELGRSLDERELLDFVGVDTLHHDRPPKLGGVGLVFETEHVAENVRHRELEEALHLEDRARRALEIEIGLAERDRERRRGPRIARLWDPRELAVALVKEIELDPFTFWLALAEPRNRD